MILAVSAIIIASPTLPAQTGAVNVPPDRAAILVRVPADAIVTVGEQATRQTGTDRLFTTLPLAPGFTYSYEIVARWKKDGADATAKATVEFHPGQVRIVDLTVGAQAPKTARTTEPEPSPKAAGKTEPEKKVDKKIDKKKTKVVKDKIDSVELPLIAGTITAVDEAKASFTMALDDGTMRTFLVSEDTKFVGPKGGSRGMGRPALKDETFVQGSAVRVAAAPDGKTALEVRLPARKTPLKGVDKGKN
jgi:uncharacterized protein (TIGR03000 family)